MSYNIKIFNNLIFHLQKDIIQLLKKTFYAMTVFGVTFGGYERVTLFNFKGVLVMGSQNKKGSIKKLNVSYFYPYRSPNAYSVNVGNQTSTTTENVVPRRLPPPPPPRKVPQQRGR